MKITPMYDKIQIKLEASKAGALDTSSMNSIQEIAEVIALPSEAIDGIKVGDKLLVKGWAIDVFTIEGEKLYFIDAYSDAICAKIK